MLDHILAPLVLVEFNLTNLYPPGPRTIQICSEPVNVEERDVESGINWHADLPRAESPWGDSKCFSESFAGHD